MSYNIFVAIILGLGFIIPVLSTYMFRRGYDLGIKDYNLAHPDTPKHELAAKPSAPTPEVPAEIKRYQTLLDNIENYDGTGAHQKEID